MLCNTFRKLYVMSATTNTVQPQGRVLLEPYEKARSAKYQCQIRLDPNCPETKGMTCHEPFKITLHRATVTIQKSGKTAVAHE